MVDLTAAAFHSLKVLSERMATDLDSASAKRLVKASAVLWTRSPTVSPRPTVIHTTLLLVRPRHILAIQATHLSLPPEWTLATGTVEPVEGHRQASLTEIEVNLSHVVEDNEVKDLDADTSPYPEVVSAINSTPDAPYERAFSVV